MKIYYEHFESVSDICTQFCIPESSLDGAEIIYACYDCPPYEGDAHVIFVKDGVLYEAHGAHCSCYGLEDQWSPEETIPLAILNRPNVAEEAKANVKEYYKNLIVFM